MKQVMVLALALALPGLFVAQAQQSTATTAKTTRRRAAAKTDAVATQLNELKQAIDAQQQQIKQLSDQVQGRDQQIQQLQQRLDQSQAATTQAESKAEAAQSQASAQSQTVDSLKSDVADLKSNTTNAAVALQETQKNIAKQFESPAALHYKGITITPGGFVAAETVTRQRAVSGDINTPFNSIPYPGNSLSKVWENNLTGRQSRLSLLAEGKYGTTKLTGYWEADWLGTGVTSNNRQSNSYVLRQRVIYGQAKMDNGFSFSAGQMWSLVTEDKKGIDNRQELPPLTIDPQYQVGFSWARQYGARAVMDYHGKFAIGIAAEGPQATIGGRGFSTITAIDNSKGTVNTTTNTFINAPGSGGGLFNFVDTSGYTINKSPDGIVKVALDPGWGHYEVYGVVSPFRNRVFPCAVVGTDSENPPPAVVPGPILCPVNGSTKSSSLGAYNDTRVGGGVGANFRLPVVPKVLDFEAQGLAGDGVGRYGSAQIADLTFRPNGTEALIRTAHGMGGFEYHSNKLDAYVYGGAEYGARTSYIGYNSITTTTTAAIPPVAAAGFAGVPSTSVTALKLNQIGGYGSPFANNSGCVTENPPNNTTGATTVGGLNATTTPSGGGSCAGDTRLIEEGTIGFWYKFFQGPKGGLRWGLQYSYFERNGWSGNNNKPVLGFAPKSVDNMVWTSFRYYIP